MREPIRVAALQTHCESDGARNLERTCEMIIEAAGQGGAQVICLQELFHSLYFCQSEDHRNFDLAESIPGPTSERLGKLAKELGVVIVAGLFERRAAGLYHNSAITLDADGELVGLYRKMHIPDDPSYFEKFYFTPGDLGFRSAKTRFGEIGVCICWDQWFPEAARLTALRGAELLVFPTAIGWLEEDKIDYGESQLDAWTTMMRSHAIANGVFVVAPNRVGLEDQIEFWGSSFICDPNGVMMQRASSSEGEYIVAECNLDSIDVVRTHWPFLRDRRIDAYHDLTARYLDDKKEPNPHR